MLCPECGWPDNPREGREDCWRYDLDKECRRGLKQVELEVHVPRYRGPTEPEFKKIVGDDRWVK